MLLISCLDVTMARNRKFLISNYANIRQSDRTITVRECEGVEPTVIATYSYGIEKKINLMKLNESEIETIIEKLEKES